MIYVGIDIAKSTHTFVILDMNGKVIKKPTKINNDRTGFNSLIQTIQSIEPNSASIKVGLKATGHYHYNLIKFLLKEYKLIYILNPLSTSLYKHGISLRKTKTDQIDAYVIANMLASNINLKPYTLQEYHKEELKSLTRYRFTMVQQRSRLKTSILRLIDVMFPELETLISSLHQASIYALLEQYPGIDQIKAASLQEITTVLKTTSAGRYGEELATQIINAAKSSIGTSMVSKSLELQQTIRRVRELNTNIKETDKLIKQQIDRIKPFILSIPGISYTIASMIIAEIGDFSRFSSADKILAYAGMSPSTYQSGNLISTHAKMEKRGSTYLRYALYSAARFVCHWDQDFSNYLSKKRAEGKHYNVAISHAAKRLVRLIYSMETLGTTYQPK